jgi:bifunctional DNA-binding transcriptional regulator/antitoxin component of YhaV-PrlF toxin-antitoxin module
MYHGRMRVTLKTDKRGRVTLPPEVRAAAGFSPHMDLVVEVADNTVTLKSATAERREILKAARGQFAGVGGGTTELLANRRKEFEKEEAERRVRSGHSS